jgi:copper transport protein
VRRAAALVLVIAGALLAISQPGQIQAHAALRSSDPGANAFLQRAPARVTLTFTEPIDSRSSTIQVLDAQGSLVETATPAVSGVTMSVELPQIGPGIYNVLWGNVSRIDGHAIKGSFPFTVLNADGSVPDITNTVIGLTTTNDQAPRPDGIAVRALSLLGLAMVAAGAVIALLWKEATPGVRRGLVLTVYAGTAVLAVATLLSLFGIRDAYSGVRLAELVFETQSGGYWLTRMGLVLLIAVVNTFAAGAPRRTAAALMGAVALYLWAYTATSHAAAVPGSGWARGIDFLHGMAALSWIGAVLGIAVAARLGRREDHWGLLVPRFSLTASAMVFILLTSGFLGAFVEVDSASKLTQTRYGVTLLVKLGLMLPLLGVAGYNAKWAKARLAAALPGEPRRFRYLVTAELALGLAVFVAAAALTQTTASRSITLEPDRKAFDQQSTFSDLQIRLGIDPNQTGLNTYRVELTDSVGAGVTADRVRLTFRYQEDQSIGASTLTLSRSGESLYLGQGPFMTLEGRWRVEVEVRRPDVDDVTGFFDVRPAGLPVAGAVSSGAWSKPTPGLSWNQFGGLVFVLVGLGFAFFRTPIRGLGKRAAWVANGLTMSGFAFGLLLLFAVHAHEPDASLPANPVFPDANSISAGRTLYEQNCLSCHGRTGVPPPGLGLNPYPLDLTVHVPNHLDGQLYNFTANGVPGTAMVAWKDAGLTEEEIWHLVNYLRTFAPVDQ